MPNEMSNVEEQLQKYEEFNIKFEFSEKYLHWDAMHDDPSKMKVLSHKFSNGRVGGRLQIQVQQDENRSMLKCLKRNCPKNAP